MLLFTQGRSYSQGDLLEEQNQGQNIFDEAGKKAQLRVRMANFVSYYESLFFFLYQLERASFFFQPKLG